MEFAKQFFRDLILLLTEPVRFFKERFSSITFAQALTFGILTQWIAAFFEWLTRVVKHETLWDGLHRIQEQFSGLPIWKDIPPSIWNQTPETSSALPSAWTMEVGALIISPFQSLASFCISGLFLFLGGMLLIPKSEGQDRDRLDLSLFIGLSALTSAPTLVGSILGFLPLNLGGSIGWVYHIAILIIGISTRFKVSSLRAGGIVFLPGISLILCFACIIGLFAGVIAKLFGAV